MGLLIDTNNETIQAEGAAANIDITITPKASGNIVLDSLKWPNADGTANQVLQTDGAGNLSFATAGGGSSEWTDGGTFLHPTDATTEHVVIGATTNASGAQLEIKNAAGDNAAKMLVLDHDSTSSSNQIIVEIDSDPVLGTITEYDLRGLDIHLFPNLTQDVEGEVQLFLNRNRLDLDNITIGNSEDGTLAQTIRGIWFDVAGNPTLNDTDGTNGIEMTLTGAQISTSTNPTLTSVAGSSTIDSYGAFITAQVISAGNSNLDVNVDGVRLISGGNLTTTGTTAHRGVYILSVTGTADTNYGLQIGTVSGATTNWGVHQATADKNYFGSQTGFGNETPSAQVHVDQSSTTAAIPVLYLDQADISEEMIEFNTTIGTGNAIEAIGAKTLTTTHFIKVTLPGGLTRYIPVGTIA